MFWSDVLERCSRDVLERFSGADDWSDPRFSSILIFVPKIV